MSTIDLDIDNIPDDDPININFSENGYDSKAFLKNADSTLIFMTLYLLGWLILLIIKLISFCIKK